MYFIVNDTTLDHCQKGFSLLRTDITRGHSQMAERAPVKTKNNNTSNGATKVPPLFLKPPSHPEMTRRMKKKTKQPEKKNPTPKLNRKYMFYFYRKKYYISNGSKNVRTIFRNWLNWKGSNKL